MSEITKSASNVWPPPEVRETQQLANATAIEGSMVTSALLAVCGSCLAPTVPLAGTVAAFGLVGYGIGVIGGWFLTGRFCPLPIVRRGPEDLLAMVAGGSELVDMGEPHDWMGSYSSRTGLEAGPQPLARAPRVIAPATVGQASAQKRARAVPITAPPVQAPPVQAPPVQAPPIQAPPVQAPPVQAPSVKAPPVQAPPVQAPPVQAPPVQAPPVQAPPVQAPPVQPPPVQAPPSRPARKAPEPAEYAPPANNADFLGEDADEDSTPFVPTRRLVDMDELMRSAHAGSASLKSLAPDRSLPTTVEELFARSKEEIPLFFKMPGATCTRVVGTQRSGKTYSVVLRLLWEQCLLSDFARKKKTFLGRLIRVHLVAPAPRKGEEYRTLPGWRIYGHDPETRVTNEAEIIKAFEVHRSLMSPKGEGNFHYWVLDECSRHLETATRVLGDTDGLAFLKEYYGQLLQESSKFEQPAILISHGDNSAHFPGAYGRHSTFLAQTARWSPYSEQVEDEYGIEQNRPTGRFSYQPIAAGSAPAQVFSGQTPAWMTVEFLQGFLEAQLKFHGRDFKEPY